jgi:hypothetical protein
VAKSTAGDVVAWMGIFSQREYKGGRVKVYGCSPGCLLVSLALSLLLTLAVNGCLHLL